MEKAYGNFKKWALSHGYREGLSIDRIDVNGPYCPENCRWITLEEQNWNMQQTIHVSMGGKQYTIKELSQKYGIDEDNLRDRIQCTNSAYVNWSLNDKLFIPIGERRDKYYKEHNIVDPFIVVDEDKYNNALNLWKGEVF